MTPKTFTPTANQDIEEFFKNRFGKYNPRRTIKLNEELYYTPPAPPKDRTEILFHDKKKKDQYWRRPTDLPKIFWEWNEDVVINAETTEWDEGNLISLSVEDTITLFTLREREMERRQKGIFFFNNGDIEYISGHNYFFLTYCYMPGAGYPDFRKFQRDVHYVIELAKNDKDVLGCYFHKAKKTGLTQIIVSMFLNDSTMYAEKSFGFMNKSQPEADGLNMVLFKAAYERMPAIMAPKITKEAEWRIIFGKPPAKYTGTKKSIGNLAASKKLKALNTWIFTAATTLEPKFDGPKMYEIQLDELPKYKISVKKLLEKIAETVKLQQTIIGKIWVTSYPPEEDTPGFEEAKKIYYESKLTTIKSGLLGRTQSQLICYFVSALVSTDGTFDIYGNANQAEAFRLNDAERLNCGSDRKALQAKIRQYPRNEEESWRSGGAGSTFDTVHWAEAKEKLEKKLRNGEILYVDVNLMWKNGKFGEVTYQVVTEAEKLNGKRGWWRIYEMPEYKDLNQIFKDDDGLFTPISDTKHLAGVDVTEYVNTSDIESEPSNNCITVRSHFDLARDTAFGRPASNKRICVYHGRKEDSNDFIEDLVLTMFFFGMYLLIEANKRWVITKLKEMKLQNFLLCRQNDGTITPYTFGEKNMSVSTNKDVIDTICRLINRHYKYPQMPGEVDNCLQVTDIDYIEQVMNFKPHKTKKYDMVMSDGYSLMALEAFSAYEKFLYTNKLSDDGMIAFGEYLMNAV